MCTAQTGIQDQLARVKCSGSPGRRVASITIFARVGRSGGFTCSACSRARTLLYVSVSCWVRFLPPTTLLRPDAALTALPALLSTPAGARVVGWVQVNQHLWPLSWDMQWLASSRVWSQAVPLLCLHWQYKVSGAGQLSLGIEGQAQCAASGSLPEAMLSLDGACCNLLSLPAASWAYARFLAVSGTADLGATGVSSKRIVRCMWS